MVNISRLSKAGTGAFLALALACTSTNKSVQNTASATNQPAVAVAAVAEEKAPEENRFSKVVLANKLDEPMQLSVLDDGRILFSERKGKLKMYEPATKTTEVIGTLPVYFENEDGLLGFATGPDFAANQHIYLYYAPVGAEEINRLSRFTLKNGELDIASEKINDYRAYQAGLLPFGRVAGVWAGRKFIFIDGR